jgi:hypothetical protein
MQDAIQEQTTAGASPCQVHHSLSHILDQRLTQLLHLLQLVHDFVLRQVCATQLPSTCESNTKSRSHQQRM